MTRCGWPRSASIEASRANCVGPVKPATNGARQAVAPELRCRARRGNLSDEPAPPTRSRDSLPRLGRSRHPARRPASRAVDGNLDGGFWNGSLSHTASESQPWWQADLGSSKKLTSIVVWNRTDCCQDRLKDFYVLTSDQPFASTDLKQTLNQPGVRAYRVRGIGDQKALSVGGTARYVRVQSALTGYLTLAEVQIYSNEKPVRADVAEHIRENQFGMFIHYGLGTYTNEQWATSNTSPTVFNPTNLDTDQWAVAAKSAGMKYGVLTTKHHDGFALWDTASNTYDVASSPYGGDVVRRYADSFRAAGLNVGLYYSIWDRSNGDSTELVINQLRELLTQYGFVNQLWFDAWAFGPGYGKIPYDQVADFVRNVSPGTSGAKLSIAV